MEIIRDKYIVVQKIGSGKFGDVYKGRDVQSGEPVAIKCELSASEYSSIKHEVKLMTYLYKNSFKQLPRVYWYGVESPYTFLVMSFYDCCLENCVFDNKMAISCIKIIRDIHGLFVLHRDIKPANFMMKNGEIFLIDFGLSTFYTNEHGDYVANKHQETITGTPKFVSYNNHCHHTLSRRDDLISLGYMMMFLKYKGLYWQGQLDIKNQKSWEKISEYLRDDSVLFKYMDYCYLLEYSQKPDYEYLMNLF